MNVSVGDLAYIIRGLPENVGRVVTVRERGASWIERLLGHGPCWRVEVPAGSPPIATLALFVAPNDSIVNFKLDASRYSWTADADLRRIGAPGQVDAIADGRAIDEPVTA